MRIFVCISKAPDTTTKISFKDGDTQFNDEKVQWIINPYDEWYALVRALEIKEAQGGKVTVINVGGADSEPIIRKALAIGADDGVRIDAEPTDTFNVASQIANYLKGQEYDMVLLGKETINYNGSVLGGMLAELLDLPYVSLGVKLDIEGNTATIERDIEGGREVVEVATPFVASAQKGMAEARIPNMRGIMAARTKPVAVEAASEAATHTSVKSYQLPPAKSDVRLISPDNVGELADLLHNEAKVI